MRCISASPYMCSPRRIRIDWTSAPSLQDIISAHSAYLCSPKYSPMSMLSNSCVRMRCVLMRINAFVHRTCALCASSTRRASYLFATQRLVPSSVLSLYALPLRSPSALTLYAHSLRSLSTLSINALHQCSPSRLTLYAHALCSLSMLTLHAHSLCSLSMRSV